MSLKKNIKIKINLIAIIFFFLLISNNNIFCLDSIKSFESLMEMHLLVKEEFSKEDYEELDFFKTIYEKNSEKLFGESNEINTIPKVIHFIWVGKKSFPKKSVKNVESWIKYHPDWKIKFWTDRDRPCPVESMEKHFISELKMDNIGIYFKQTSNPGEQADLIRYELLYHEGGVYVDHDIECFQSFEKLTSRFDFYAFLEVPHYNLGYPYPFFPTNALIGCKPYHPILKKAMQFIAITWEEMTNKYYKPSMTLMRVLHRTFIPFTKGIKEEISDDNYINIILPAAFIFADKRIPTEIVLQRIHEYCCLANHTYDGSWR